MYSGMVFKIPIHTCGYINPCVSTHYDTRPFLVKLEEVTGGRDLNGFNLVRGATVYTFQQLINRICIDKLA